jgi:CheY-like chemotaxis protein
MDQLKILRSVRILLIEDSPSDVRLIREALRDSQLMVHISLARDGAEGMDHLEACKSGSAPMPDLILLDLNLPKKSGREVLDEVKHDPELKKIPVLVMTSSFDENDISSAYRLNANCYIQKPNTLAEYERVVRAIEDFWFMTVTLPETYTVPNVVAKADRTEPATRLN